MDTHESRNEHGGTPAQRLDAVAAAIASHRERPGALLPILHEIQDAVGWIPADAVPRIAHALSLSRAEVHGVLTFYQDFRREPPGRHVVQVCRAEACQACGSDTLYAQASRLLDCPQDETRADGAVTLEAAYCLGLCAAAPSLRIDGRLHARVTPEGLGALLATLGDRR
ncbi:MAG: hypothetical protein RIS35_531 [Pseudomonadota bacterium]